MRRLSWAPPGNTGSGRAFDRPEGNQIHIDVDEPVSIGFGRRPVRAGDEALDRSTSGGRAFVRHLNVVFYMCESRLCGVRILDVAKASIEMATRRSITSWNSPEPCDRDRSLKLERSSL